MVPDEIASGEGWAMMNDDELAEYLHLSPEHAALVIPKLSPARRAVYERMKLVEFETELWIAGLGSKPQGVLIDTERSVRSRKGWR